jgi:hypothetical protein
MRSERYPRRWARVSSYFDIRIRFRLFPIWGRDTFSVVKGQGSWEGAGMAGCARSSILQSVPQGSVFSSYHPATKGGFSLI